jgi:hypothetical protein
MLGFRRVRRAAIPSDERDVFERYGETISQMMVAANFAPRAADLTAMYSNDVMIANAVLWLTERGDTNANHEWRIEIVEWSILIFVIVGVIVESGLGNLIFRRVFGA